MSKEGRVNRQGLKGMGDDNKWCEESMETRMNGILTFRLLCMSFFKNDKSRRSWWTKVAVAEKHSVLVSFRCTKLSSLKWMEGTLGPPH